MITAAIIGLVFMVGWVASIYPINRAIVRSHVRKQVQYAHNRGRQEFDLDRSIPVVAGLLATVLGAFWMVGLPFYMSYLLYARRLPSLDTQIEEHVDTEFSRDMARRQLAEARKELQAEIGVGEIVEESDWERELRRSRESLGLPRVTDYRVD